AASALAAAQQKPVAIHVDWSSAEPLRTTPTLQAVVNPMLLRGSPIHDAAFADLKELGADDVRFAFWHPYPKLAVAELDAPTAAKTSWDFSLIDPLVADFFHATEGHSVILSMSTIPEWMYKTEKPVAYPADPSKLTWNYIQGKELRDATCGELAAYYKRVAEWYTQGGFTDELGQRHESGLHYTIPYWEVFNEIDVEHQPSPEQYTDCYDAIVGPLHTLDPKMKFVGLALAFPERHPEMLEYFLDPAHHQAGIPVDMISYHFYAVPTREQTVEDWQYTLFDQADRLIATIRFIEQMRKRLSPRTRTTMDEVGTILPTDWHPDDPYNPGPPIPPVYWNASGALFAYFYLEAAKLGIDAVGESQLVGFPSQFPSVTMVDWNSGKPNARFEVLRLLHDYAIPGSERATTKFPGTDIDALALKGRSGRVLLLVNKRDRPIAVELPAEFAQGTSVTVDESSGDTRPAEKEWSGTAMTLAPFAVTAITAK
ncbi:MAG: glycosyl hydrolase family 39, partial [Terracidiphilus sp.]